MGPVEMFVELPISVVTASTALVLYMHKINQLGVQHGKILNVVSLSLLPAMCFCLSLSVSFVSVLEAVAFCAQRI